MKVMVLNMHKCGKVVALSLLSFSLIFFIFLDGLSGLFSFYIFYFGGHLWPLLFSHMGQCSINDDHQTFNSKLRATMTLYGIPSVVYRDNDLAWHRH